jgi:hypothetical protein
MHSVFYSIKYPEDHILNNRKTKTIFANGTKTIQKGWIENAGDRMHFTETHDSVVVTVKPNLPNKIELQYQFSPAKHIIVFPLAVIVFLSFSSLYIMELSICSTIPELCRMPLWLQPTDPTIILDRVVEISGAIIAASFVLPRLIRNSHIRHRMLALYFIPVVLAIGLLIK